MRNALLTCAASVLVFAVLWHWLGAQRERRAAPVERSVAAPVSARDASVRTADDAAPAGMSASQLTARALHTFERDPNAALADIALADQQSGTHDEGRRAIEIKALVRLGKVGHARALTEAFYREFPGSARGAELERLTGSHPRP